MATNCVSNSSHWQAIRCISRVPCTLSRFSLQNLIMHSTSKTTSLPRLLQSHLQGCSSCKQQPVGFDIKSKSLKLKFLSCCRAPPAQGRQYLPQPCQEPSGRGERGMQPLVPTSQGSAGDQRRAVCKTNPHHVHSASPTLELPCLGPRTHLGARWHCEAWLIVSWHFCSTECQGSIAIISTLLPEDPGYATAFHHCHTILARWKSYFRSLKISRGQEVNELFLFFWLHYASHGCGFCCDFHRYQNLLQSWMCWQIQRI